MANHIFELHDLHGCDLLSHYKCGLWSEWRWTCGNEGCDTVDDPSAFNCGLSALRKVEEGGNVARKALLAMDGIKTSTQKNSKINSVTDAILFQANLLTLNAGVEAALAGKHGVYLVDHAGLALAVIVNFSANISNRISSIATLAHKQAGWLAESNKAVNKIDQVTQQNASIFEETTTANHCLMAEAGALI